MTVCMQHKSTASGATCQPPRCCRKTRRCGYSLLLCMLAAAVTGSMALGLFQMVRLRLVNSHAQRSVVQLQWIENGALEHAIATLVDQPTFRGDIGPFAVMDDFAYQLTVSDSGPNLAVVVQTNHQAATYRHSFIITPAQLAERRAAMGL